MASNNGVWSYWECSRHVVDSDADGQRKTIGLSTRRVNDTEAKLHLNVVLDAVHVPHVSVIYPHITVQLICLHSGFDLL